MPARKVATTFDEILANQLVSGERIFASGETANNHLDFDYEQIAPLYRPAVAQRLCELISRLDFNPGFIAPVPSGGMGWAEVAAKNLSHRPELIALTKLDKRIFDASDEALEQARALQGVRGIVIDDVTNDGGTSEVYAECIEAMGLKVAAVISILLRGKGYKESRFTRLPVYHKYIPLQLNWQIFQDTGKIVEL